MPHPKEGPHPRSCLLHGETFTKSLVTIGVQKPCTLAPTRNSSEGLSCHQTMPSGYPRFPIKVSVQFSHSVVSDSVTPWTAACPASLSITNSYSLLKFMSIESVMPSYHLILCRPLLLLPSIFPSIRVFSNVSVLRIRGPKFWSFSSITSLILSLLVPTSIPSHPQVLIPKVLSKPLASCLSHSQPPGKPSLQ